MVSGARGTSHCESQGMIAEKAATEASLLTVICSCRSRRLLSQASHPQLMHNVRRQRWADRLKSLNGSEDMKHRSSIRFIVEGLEGVTVALAVLGTWPLSKRWLQNWGSFPKEQRRAWPGDALVLPEHTTYTRAVTIHAPASDVWPWLVQFGLGRAGFYSYELLERLVGIPVKNIESIVPQYQDLEAGDEVLLHPKAPGIPVASLERESHICFGVVDNAERPAEKPDPARSWSMYVERRSERVSRLLLRSCVEPLRDRSFSKRLAILIDTPIDFVMEQRMLRTIQRLAESGGGQVGNPAVAS